MVPRPGWRRGWPIALLLAGAALLFVLLPHRWLSVSALLSERDALLAWAVAHPLSAPLVFGTLYAAMVACMVPGGIAMSTAAGLLFGIAEGTALTVVAVTAGSTVLLLAARSALRPVVERRFGARLPRIAERFERDGAMVLLAARLLPFAPFWLTNLAAAMTRIRVATFALVTAVGVTPITLALTATGAGLGSGGAAEARSLLRPEIALPLVLAAALCLVPVLWRWRRSGRQEVGH